MSAFTFSIPYILSFFITLGVGLYGWRRRHEVAAARPFAIAVLTQATLALGFIFELFGVTLEAKIFWDNFQWIGTLLAPVALLVFALVYSGRRPKNPGRTWCLLLVFPFIFYLFVYTNQWHELIGSNYQVISGTPFSALTYDFGTLGYLGVLYFYGTMLATFYFLVLTFRGSGGIYRAQITGIIIGTALPTIGGLLVIANVEIFFLRDTTPITSAIGNLIIAWGLFRYRFLDVTPVARGTVVENMQDAVIVIDNQQQVVDINPAGRALFSADTNFIGLPIAQLFDDMPDIVNRYLAVDQIHEEISLNEEEYYSISITPIFDRQGSNIGRVVILRDITTRKQAEKMLHQRTEALEKANQELEIARKKAEESDQTKTQFLASMSHELRTPLNGIINFTEMVSSGMMGDINDDQKDLLEQSLDSSKHLLSLINDVLDITKIQAGRLNLFIEDNVNILDELSSVIKIVQPMIKEDSVSLITDIDETIPPMRGDRRRLRQVLLNLASNAVKFTPEGFITIQVKNNDDHVLLAVIDTGIGISKEMQEIIFDPFIQTTDGVKHAQGTGLGLPITKSLVEAHNGRIWLESAKDKGTTFYVSLPTPVTEKEKQAIG